MNYLIIIRLIVLILWVTIIVIVAQAPLVLGWKAATLTLLFGGVALSLEFLYQEIFRK